MESKDLNDIVIEDNENSKKTQLKNILTLLALLFIILVISIVITKLILGSDEEENNETNGSAVVETQNIDGSTAAVVGTTAALGTAAVLANRSLGDSKGEDAKSSLVERNSSSTHKKIPLRDHTPKVRHVVHHTTPRVRHTTHTTTTRHTYVKKVVHHPKPKPTHRPTHKPTPKPHIAKKSSVTDIEKGYYIQIGAFKDPSNAIKNIKKDHLSYKIEKIKDGELTRVLVGPYDSRKEAKSDLSKVQDDISKNAYIKKI